MKATKHHFDLIIVGLGAMGSAAFYQAAKRGLKVLGIDRYTPPHTMGSSHAETRITRLAVGEGIQYVPLVARSHEIWKELEEKSGQPLFLQSGGLIIGAREGGARFHGTSTDFLLKTKSVGDQYGIPVEFQSATAIQSRFPNLRIQNHERAVYEPGAGVVLCEDAIAVQLQLGRQYGGFVHFNEAVQRLSPHRDHIEVSSTINSFRAERAIVCTGPWINDFLPASKLDLFRVCRQVVYWFEAESLPDFGSDRFPFAIWIGRQLGDFFTVFPAVKNGIKGVKMVTEQYEESTSPSTVDRRVTAAEVRHFYDNFAAQKLNGIRNRCIKQAVCLYTVSPDEHFIIDQHPEHDRILFASPCSGHGFKHSAAIGEALVQQAMDGRSILSLDSFRLKRFGT